MDNNYNNCKPGSAMYYNKHINFKLYLIFGKVVQIL